jgi:RNA recognition motif-containing protein
MVTYNQNGSSRGIASITFNKPDTAAKAAKELNGLLVDGRPMKVHHTPSGAESCLPTNITLDRGRS